MRVRFKEWLFNGVTASAVLMSISTFDAGHPLARSARIAGILLALLCLVCAAVLAWARRGMGQKRR